jgi:hypothetical protein
LNTTADYFVAGAPRKWVFPNTRLEDSIEEHEKMRINVAGCFGGSAAAKEKLAAPSQMFMLR